MEELWTWSAGNVKFMLFIHYTIIFPQITVVSALTNLTIPTRTGSPHQPMMSPRTAWRKALQELGNRIPAVQKSISIWYIFKGFTPNHIYNRQYVCKKPDKNHGGAAVKTPFETFGCEKNGTTKSVAKCWPGWTHQGSSCYLHDTSAVILTCTNQQYNI